MEPTERSKFEQAMIDLGYDEDEFEGFDAEGEFTYHSQLANCMYDAWCAAKEAA